MSDRDEAVLPAGTYRVLDGKLYRVEPGLPPSLDTRAAEIATLRTRAEAAEAEVARLRGGTAAADWARSVMTAAREAREAALREAADVARAHGGISAYYAILKLAADSAPAAEGE